MTAYKHLAAVIFLWGAWLHTDTGHAQAIPQGDLQRPQTELDRLQRDLKRDPAGTDRSGKGLSLQIETRKSGSWGSLRTEMTQNEVEKLLGRPDRVESLPDAVRWHWDKSKPRGWVSFDQNSRKVREWRYF